MITTEQTNKATAAAVLMGIGLGGFVDGIVLHQILQWHNMVSNWYPPTTMEIMMLNMTWDGIFHAAVWLITMVGVFMLWSAAFRHKPIPSLKPFTGAMVFGWGLFNLVEGIVDHQILGVHYVRQVPNYTVYNLTFLALTGVGFILVGWLMMKANRVEVAP
jgi:uncharacterized membrane protein